MDNGYESEIDLKDLLFHILYKWRILLIAGLIGSILLGGYKFFCNTREARGEEGKCKEIREYEIALAEYELNKANYERSISDYQKWIEQQETYMKKSVLMQVNPYDKPTASADVFVKLDNTEWSDLPDNINLDPTDSLILVYTSNFLSTIDWEPIEKLTGVEALYLKELLWVTTDYNSNTFTVGIVYRDGATAQQILDIIMGQVITRYQSMDMDINRHTISVVNQALTHSIDSTLADLQKSNADTLAYYEQIIIDYRKNLESLEAPVKPHSVRKYLVVGFAAGIFLVAVCYGLAYLLGGKLHSEKELRERYGYRLLGIVSPVEKNGLFQWVDRLLKRLEGAERQATGDEAYQLVAINLTNLVGKNKNIVTTGTIDISKLQKLTESVAASLKEVTLSVAENVNMTAETLKRLPEYDAVILVEEKDKSSLAEIQKEQETITALNKPILGYVLLR